VRLLAAREIVNDRLVPIVVVEFAGVAVDGGMVAVKVEVDVPTESFPLKVSQVIVPVPLFAFVSAEASEVGTVQLTAVEEVFVAIVPEADPKV